MMTKPDLSRRHLLRLGLGATAGLLTVGARAAAVATPQQTEGPFFPTKDQPDKDADMTLIQGHSERARGQVVKIAGRVLDLDGKPVSDALVDAWQANTHGRYAHERDPNPAPLDPNFQGWARLVTDADGRFNITTIKPGAYPANRDWWRPPHIHFKVARRGYRELTTQMYFAGEALNDKDLILQELAPAERAAVIVDFTAHKGAVREGDFQLVLTAV